MKVVIYSLLSELLHSPTDLKYLAQMMLAQNIEVTLIVIDDDQEKEIILIDKRLQTIRLASDELMEIPADLREKLQSFNIVILYHNLSFDKYLALKEFLTSSAKTPIIVIMNKIVTNNLFAPDRTIYLFFNESLYNAFEKANPATLKRLLYWPLDSENVQRVRAKIALDSADYLVIAQGKLRPSDQLDKVAALAGIIKCISYKEVKVIFCDLLEAGIDNEKAKYFIKVEGYKNGLDLSDMLFTSDIGYPDGYPRFALLELFKLSNLFICPSSSSEGTLTTIDAAKSFNFLVLNKSVPALKEIGDQLGAYFIDLDPVSSNEFKSDDPANLYQTIKHAEKIITLMDDNPLIKAMNLARKTLSFDWIWKNQLEPLFLELTNSKT